MSTTKWNIVKEDAWSLKFRLNITNLLWISHTMIQQTRKIKTKINMIEKKRAEEERVSTKKSHDGEIAIWRK